MRQAYHSWRNLQGTVEKYTKEVLPMAAGKVKYGYKVTGTIKSVKGHCSAGHTAGDKFEISGRETAGLCGWFYYAVFPNVVILQSGGDPWGDGVTVEKGILMRCPDIDNEVTIELKRKRFIKK
jgi:uncharacterized repeat protein (TIGR04076 family)